MLKIGGQEALDALLEQDAEGIGALVLGGGLTGRLLPDRGGADTPALIHWWNKLEDLERFGQTEAMSLITRPEDRKIGSIGKPIKDVEVKISY